jgi:hypothetical protein
MRRATYLRLTAVIGVATLLWLSACAPKQNAPETARIVLTADIRGRLVPCGCFTGQLGGMTRLYTILQQDSDQPELRLDAGDAIQGTQDFEIMEYYSILKAFEMMRFQALNIGAREAQLSAETHRKISADTHAPLVSANLIDTLTGEPIHAPFIETSIGSQRVIITGILDTESMDSEALGDGLSLADPILTLRDQLPELRQRCDVLILLAFANENRLRVMAEQFYEADFILGGDVSQPSGNTRQINQSHVFYVANESRTLGFINFKLSESPDHKRTQIEVLNARPELLYEEIPEAPAIIDLAITYREAVRYADLNVDHPELHQQNQIDGIRTIAQYVGTESCMHCHSDAYTVWKETGHADAWAPLVEVQADADPSCIACHSIGFGSRSGYRREFEHEKLIDVGCESCHGPGSQHVEERTAGGPVDFHFRPLAEGDCRSCHYGEFSRPFDWDSFWPQVAHGKAVRSPSKEGGTQ